MSIHQTIYETLHMPVPTVVDITGAGDPIGIERRRIKMRMFLETNAWDESLYKKWLRANAEYPNAVTLMKNIADATSTAIASQFESVDSEEEERRKEICAACEHFVTEHGRCSLCGCFTALKARMKTWHCPVKKW